MRSAPLTDLAASSVRPCSPCVRSTIFADFARLAPGEAFTLVNDHDPKPLYYQFTFEHPGEVDWRYLEEGPEVWRVRIGKVDKAPSGAH
jgi:uncharacterized protein (DUF2249 family)